jgi:Caspase domain
MRSFFGVVLAIIASVLSLSAWPAASLAEKRIALLIGNKDYKAGVGALVNPLNDIGVVGQALKTVGFEVMQPMQNATRTTMLIAVHSFAARLKDAGPDAIGFLYYSGHGIASAGENYLVPVDIDEPSTMLLSVQGVKHSEVLAILRGEAPNAAHYLVLDACRNTLQGSRGGKGFVPVGQQSGVLVAFAAEPGKTASDAGQSSGPYAAALAAELVKPDQNDLLMFHRVRVAVMDKTNGDQVPWTEDGIQRRERVLLGRSSGPAPAAAAPAAPSQQRSEAERQWENIKSTTSIGMLEAFIRRYGDTFQGDLARVRLEELRKQQIAAARPPPAAPAPARPSALNWYELGCQSLSKEGETIRLGRQSERFRAIRLHARGIDIQLLQLRVFYNDGQFGGQSQDVPIRAFIRSGERTQPLDLQGDERSIDRIDMVYRSVPNSGGTAAACVEGLR